MILVPALRQAYGYKANGIPFVAPRSLQAMLYAYGKDGFSIVSSVMVPKNKDPFEVIRRFEEFIAKYPVENKT